MKRQLMTALLLAALAGAPAVLTTGCAVARHQETAGQYGRDAEITARVKTKMYKDPDVKASEVNVTTMNGVVQLSGFVDSEGAKARAGAIARETPGVLDVHNDLITPTGRGAAPMREETH